VVFLSVFTSIIDGLGSSVLDWDRIALFLFLALGVSFLCSLLEAIILSVTWSHIEILGKGEKGSGTRLKKLKNNIDHPSVSFGNRMSIGSSSMDYNHVSFFII
jgi:hypothetical protein